MDSRFLEVDDDDDLIWAGRGLKPFQVLWGMTPAVGFFFFIISCLGAAFPVGSFAPSLPSSLAKQLFVRSLA